jgi:hypothetical protein
MISAVWTREDGEMPKRFLRVAAMLSPSLLDSVIRIEKCVCGEERFIFDDVTDSWKNHVHDIKVKGGYHA